MYVRLPGVPGRLRFRFEEFEELGLGFEIGSWIKVEREDGDDEKSSLDIIFDSPSSWYWI